MIATIALALAATPAAGMDFTCTPTRVWDGDGPIWCAESHRLRLRGIAARELGGRCRQRQPCPKASGVAARGALVALLGGSHGRTREGHVLVVAAPLACRSFGPDGYGRVVASCRLGDGRDLGCTLLRQGVVARWRRYGGASLCRDGQAGDKRPQPRSTRESETPDRT